jgi:hypothetical protein
MVLGRYRVTMFSRSAIVPRSCNYTMVRRRGDSMFSRGITTAECKNGTVLGCRVTMLSRNVMMFTRKVTIFSRMLRCSAEVLPCSAAGVLRCSGAAGTPWSGAGVLRCWGAGVCRAGCAGCLPLAIDTKTAGSIASNLRKVFLKFRFADCTSYDLSSHGNIPVSIQYQYHHCTATR